MLSPSYQLRIHASVHLPLLVCSCICPCIPVNPEIPPRMQYYPKVSYFHLFQYFSSLAPVSLDLPPCVREFHLARHRINLSVCMHPCCCRSCTLVCRCDTQCGTLQACLVRKHTCFCVPLRHTTRIHASVHISVQGLIAPCRTLVHSDVRLSASKIFPVAIS